MGVLRENPNSSWYLREENGGFILGLYETGAPCCYLDGPDEASEYELFPEDMERLAPHIETAIARVPAFGEVGIKKVYNGAIAYTPDGSPIVGPAWEVPNFWLNEGHSFGVTAAGGAGWQLAEWIVEGEPSIDMMGVDPRRFGPYAARGYLRVKNEEAYGSVFTVHYPDEERVAARPLKRAPCYERMKALGAVFGTGLRLGAAELVRARQVRTLRGGPCQIRCAAQQTTIRVSRRASASARNGASAALIILASLATNAGTYTRTSACSTCRPSANTRFRGPAQRNGWTSLSPTGFRMSGGSRSAHMLSKNGGVRSEFTIFRERLEKLYLVGAGAFERHELGLSLEVHAAGRVAFISRM